MAEAGPASGYSLWVQVRHDDGTMTVYGHMFGLGELEGAIMDVLWRADEPGRARPAGPR